eukprot:3062489-Amphidinium_carterae.2
MQGATTPEVCRAWFKNVLVNFYQTPQSLAPYHERLSDSLASHAGQHHRKNETMVKTPKYAHIEAEVSYTIPTAHKQRTNVDARTNETSLYTITKAKISACGGMLFVPDFAYIVPSRASKPLEAILASTPVQTENCSWKPFYACPSLWAGRTTTFMRSC